MAPDVRPGRGLGTTLDAALRAALGRVGRPFGIVAGDRTLLPRAAALLLPGPNGGEVTTASTWLDGMANHLVLHLSHTRLVAHPEAVTAVLAFLERGDFACAAPSSSGDS